MWNMSKKEFEELYEKLPNRSQTLRRSEG
jgi:hypothetical protein